MTFADNWSTGGLRESNNPRAALSSQPECSFSLWIPVPLRTYARFPKAMPNRAYG